VAVIAEAVTDKRRTNTNALMAAIGKAVGLGLVVSGSAFTDSGSRPFSPLGNNQARDSD
jgi:predicted NBD/HSP70 family sugar kinase